MRIGINLLYLIPGYVGGTEIYAVQLLRALAKIDQENEYYLFLNRECENFHIVNAPNFIAVVTQLKATNRMARLLWEQTILPYQLHKYKIDIVHSLGYVTPFFVSCGNMVTIHDANYVAIRQVLSWGKKYFFPFFVKQSTRSADLILVVSKFSKTEIIKHTRVNRAKVKVVYSAGRDVPPAQTNWDELTILYKLQKPYFIAFGSVAAHKNITRLLQAFLKLDTDIKHNLVLVGHVPPDVDLEQYQTVINRPEARLIITGYVPDEHVLPLLSHAEWFVFPSLYEGFGLPVLEAQQCGVPVLASVAGSLPEVAADSAEFFNPYSVEDMVATLQKCLPDEELRQKLIKKGYENIKRFSWEETAHEVLKLYNSIVKARNER